MKEIQDREIGDIVDINMGCPAPKVTKNGDGSSLLQDLEKAIAVVKAKGYNPYEAVTEEDKLIAEYMKAYH